MDKINNAMYSKLPNLVLGFHGCNSETYKNVIHNNQHLKKSENDYDWLGNGVYFWENSCERAYDWAYNRYGDDTCVIGAFLDLGHCLNLTDYSSTEVLKLGYELLKNKVTTEKLPMNKTGKDGVDLLLRNLDCAVIQAVHTICETTPNMQSFDSVRGVFTEGKEIYPGSGVVAKTHIQICVVNINCIKGYFTPLPMDEKYTMP